MEIDVLGLAYVSNMAEGLHNKSLTHLEVLDNGKKFGINMSAVITDMDTPLGNCAGNSLEIKQAVEILKGNLMTCPNFLCLFVL